MYSGGGGERVYQRAIEVKACHDDFFFVLPLFPTFTLKVKSENVCFKLTSNRNSTLEDRRRECRFNWRGDKNYFDAPVSPTEIFFFYF